MSTILCFAFLALNQKLTQCWKAQSWNKMPGKKAVPRTILVVEKLKIVRQESFKKVLKEGFFDVNFTLLVTTFRKTLSTNKCESSKRNS